MPGPVREAMLRVYVHGADDSLARQVLSLEDLPALRALLKEPDFPRRDNIVAFLAHLDSGSSSQDLLDFLTDPPAPIEIPEEDRALLLAPQALGRIAARGDRVVLDLLLGMSDPRTSSSALSRAAAHSHEPDSYHADLLEMAFRGLAFSRDPPALACDCSTRSPPPARWARRSFMPPLPRGPASGPGSFPAARACPAMMSLPRRPRPTRPTKCTTPL